MEAHVVEHVAVLAARRDFLAALPKVLRVIRPRYLGLLAHGLLCTRFCEREHTPLLLPLVIGRYAAAERP